ncbi:hypothetical protein JKP88DRAFT_271435 [Tribonema minus]|uniref:SKP1-like protein n=1 Tax=Tribonema minus TaxID=303371 RepID=A0A835ZBH1_9STRA|nr:hypothetical protein JKP88DRAFT_271435 [Tribonema minus]
MADAAAAPAAAEAAPAAEETRIVHLVSREGDSFGVSVRVAKMSELVKTMLDEALEEGAAAQEILLPTVKSSVLTKVIEFCSHHVEDPMNEIEKPLKSANMREVVQDWFATYVQVEQEVLYELILAAQDMGIKPLHDLLCATMASMIHRQRHEEPRTRFNIANDFVP